MILSPVYDLKQIAKIICPDDGFEFMGSLILKTEHKRIVEKGLIAGK